MVIRGDRPLGFVNWRRHQATVAGFYWEIGIAMLPEARPPAAPTAHPGLYRLPIDRLPI